MSLSPRACTIWFTGLFGNGKVMIMNELVPLLKARGCKVEILDDEVIRVEVNQDFVLSHAARVNDLQRLVLTCRQSELSGVFTLISADSQEQAEFVCDMAQELPSVSSQRILRKLEQLGCFALFRNKPDDRQNVYSDEEEAQVTQRLAELGYV